MLGKLLIAVALLSSTPTLASSRVAAKLTGEGTGEFVYDPVAHTVTSSGSFAGATREPFAGKDGCCVTVSRTGSYVLTLKLADQLQIETDNLTLFFKKRGYRDSIATMSQIVKGFSLEVTDGIDPNFTLISFEREGASFYYYEQDAIGYRYDETGQYPYLRNDRFDRYSYALRNRFGIDAIGATSDFASISTDRQYFQVRLDVVPTVLQASYDNPYSGPVSEAFVVGGSWVIGKAVPEPSTWAMAIIGFGAVGATLRRFRRAAGDAPKVSLRLNAAESA